MKDIKLIDVYPNKGYYNINEMISICLEIDAEKKNDVDIELKVYQFNDVIYIQNDNININKENQTYKIELNMPTDKLGGYGVQISVSDNVLSTAFDIVDKWSERPRYAFLSDFYKEDEVDKGDVKSLLKHHINVVQFYDWMYKHEDLVPKTDYYTDLLDRKLSKIAVDNKIKLCKEAGILSQAYGAIYATSKEYYNTHKEFALYTNDDKPQNLGEWFFIMNISEESPWREHILSEFRKSVSEMDFAGIHMDTYGFPKMAYSKLNGHKKLEKLNEQFPSLINDTKKILNEEKDESALTFNAVGNWAIEDVAKSNQDAVYIEVWDPQDTYYHLYQLVNRAKELSGKQVILAAYLKCFGQKDKYTDDGCHASLLLTSATIFACGGFHFVIGEDNGVLPDPYYVNYAQIGEKYKRSLRNYYDFIVRYGDLIFDISSKDDSMTHANGINTECVFENGDFSSYPRANRVWTLVRTIEGYKTISLVNYTGIKSDIWNEGKESFPEDLENISVQILVDEDVKAVYIASPDYNECMSEKLEFEYCSIDRGKAIKFIVPKLRIWDLIYIEISN